jgi:hypothetical protein
VCLASTVDGFEGNCCVLSTSGHGFGVLRRDLSRKEWIFITAGFALNVSVSLWMSRTSDLMCLFYEVDVGQRAVDVVWE